MDGHARSVELSVVLTTTDWLGFGGVVRCLDALEGQVDEAVGVLPSDRMADAFTRVAPCPARTIEDPGEGLAAARNAGAEAASGDAYAFLDDDVVPTDSWGRAIREALRTMAPAAGGPALPAWRDGRPAHLARRWDWLVGCGPYYEEVREVRNTYGCNIAFRADVFDELGGFDTRFGMGSALGQAEEAELCTRLRDAFDAGVLFHPEARVFHVVEGRDIALGRLLERAWGQGAAKAEMGVGDAESRFLRNMLSGAVRDGPLGLAAGLAYLGAVGGGYMVGQIGSMAQGGLLGQR